MLNDWANLSATVPVNEGSISIPKQSELTHQIKEMIDRAWLVQGEYNKLMEDKCRNMADTKYAVSCANGTSALQLIAMGYREELSSEKHIALMPTNTHFATLAAFLNAGWDIYLLDVNKESMMMDHAKVFDVLFSLKGKVGVVVNVSISGNMTPDALSIRDLCEEQGCVMVEDACHAHFSELVTNLKTVRAGSVGHAAAFSFYPTKVVFGAEGGVVTTNESVIAEYVRKSRDVGRAIDWIDNYSQVGIGARLSNIHACIIDHVMANAKELLDWRKKVTNVYNESVWGSKLYTLQKGRRGTNNYKYTLIFNRIDHASELKHRLEGNGTPASTPVFEYPLHTHSYVLQKKPEKILNKEQSFPVADLVSKSHVCLPIPSEKDVVKNEARSVQSLALSAAETVNEFIKEKETRHG